MNIFLFAWAVIASIIAMYYYTELLASIDSDLLGFKISQKEIEKLKHQRDVLYGRFPSGDWMQELQDRHVFESPLEEELTSVLVEIKEELNGGS